ncbi:MAG: hypothetical protein NVS9B14_13760 [Candidatus Acidiferrum sp.]
MSLLVVGSVAFDGIESPYGKEERIIGGAATYFALSASYFTHVNLVGIVGDDFTAKDEKIFHGRKIDTTGLERAAGKCFFWAGRYSENLNERVTLTTELNVFADFDPKLPAKYTDSKYVFLANIAPGLQSRVLHQVKKRPKLVALDTMNYWLERTPDDLRGVFCVPAVPLEEPHDPTGAGDAFAGGFMGYLAGVGKQNDAELRRAMVYGTVMGSFTVEEFGPRRLARLKTNEIHARARHLWKLSQFKLQ